MRMTELAPNAQSEQGLERSCFMRLEVKRDKAPVITKRDSEQVLQNSGLC